jgi:Anti-sigma-K factor rskA, C-terminal
VTDKPDFRELVGEDLPPEERARLARVHDLLVTAGPPPELPPHLVQPDVDPREGSAVAFLPRRRAGLMLGLAAAIALIAFLGGFVAGRAKDTFPTAFDVPMQGTALAANASATIHVGEVDSSGNWPLKVVAHGLRPLPKGEYYEMFLTRGGKRAATCGTFRLSDGDSVRLNAPYRLSGFDGWIVTLEHPGSGRHPVVLRT